MLECVCNTHFKVKSKAGPQQFSLFLVLIDNGNLGDDLLALRALQLRDPLLEQCHEGSYLFRYPLLLLLQLIDLGLLPPDTA